jgi:hypothetical protein
MSEKLTILANYVLNGDAEIPLPGSHTEQPLYIPSANNEPGTRAMAFDEFWRLYPRKTGKGAAIKSWLKIKDPKSTLHLIIGALAWQISSDQWTKDEGQFIPMPATYLNQQRWLDEPVRVAKRPDTPINFAS